MLSISELEKLPIDSLSHKELFRCMMDEKKRYAFRGKKRFNGTPVFDELEEILDRKGHADEYFKENEKEVRQTVVEEEPDEEPTIWNTLYL